MAQLTLDVSSALNAARQISPLIGDVSVDPNELLVKINTAGGVMVGVSDPVLTRRDRVEIKLSIHGVFGWVPNFVVNFVLGLFGRPPFIVELTATRCVVDLSLFPVDKETLADLVELSSLHIP